MAHMYFNNNAADLSHQVRFTSLAGVKSHISQYLHACGGEPGAKVKVIWTGVTVHFIQLYISSFYCSLMEDGSDEEANVQAAINQSLTEYQENIRR